VNDVSFAQTHSTILAKSAIAAALIASSVVTPATAGVISVPSGNGLGGGSRWDSATRNVFVNGICCEDRSLNGGLTYTLDGGGYAAFRDMFSWSGAVPSTAAFQGAVEQAFNAWTVTDPASNFPTSLRFSYAPSITPIGFGTGTTIRGAEIDLLARTATDRWSVGNSTLQGAANIDVDPGPVKLTSGTTNYDAPAIVAADIAINSNPGATYTLDFFRRLLTHEIGHALGLEDLGIGTVSFIDNNFNAANPAATLNDSWTHLVNPLNPSASALNVYSIGASTFNTSGVNLLMESNGLGIGSSNPVTNPLPLTNDEYGMRQFLYPSLAPVPEPHQYALFGIGLALIIAAARRSRHRQHTV
jgi:hypothetical protein